MGIDESELQAFFSLLLAKKERRKFILGESHDQKGGPKNTIIPPNIVI